MSGDYKQLPVQKVLVGGKDTALAALMQKVSDWQYLSKLVHEHLDPQLAAHCEIGSFEEGELTLIVRNASWATKIRYLSADLLKQLQTESLLQSIISIRCVIEPG